MDSNSTYQDILFLFGVLQRSGTNFLNNALVMHPDIQPMQPKGEDFLLKDARLLEEYVNRTSENWNPIWGGGVDISAQQKQLSRSLGEGLAKYIQGTPQPAASTATYCLAKTPETMGVEHLPTLFPHSKALFLVREPISNIHSGVKSFGWTWRNGIDNWKKSVSRILAFQQRFPGKSIILRYEDLVQYPHKELGQVFEFLEIPKKTYPFNTLAELPVVGSSSYGSTEGKIKWEGVKAGSDFDPTKRGKQLPVWRTKMVLQATKELRAKLGYPDHSTTRMTLMESLKSACSITKDMVKDGLRYLKYESKVRRHP